MATKVFQNKSCKLREKKYKTAKENTAGYLKIEKANLMSGLIYIAKQEDMWKDVNIYALY